MKSINYKNQKNVMLRIFAVLVAAFLLISCAKKNEAALKIVDYDSDVMQQFLWLHYSGGVDEKDFVKTLDMGDPFRATSLLFRDFYDDRDLNKTKKMLDILIGHWNLYETHKLDYTFPYGRLPAGWWSGMDNMLLPMFLVAYSQVQKNDEYIELANKMMDRMLKSPAEGGILWRDGGVCWLSEYSWTGMSAKDEYYVLNGHLLALRSLKMTADALGRADLEAAYQCALEGTKSRAREFLDKGDAWALYMLTPPTINQVHYVIFETMQFDNLYALTGEEFYKDQAELRRKILRERYPVYSMGGGKRIFFSMMGAPHPYSLDTYGVSIACDSPGRMMSSFKQFDQFKEDKPLVERIFIDEEMVFDRNTSCAVKVHSVGLEFLLYKTSHFKEIDSNSVPRYLKYDADASLDGYMIDERNLIVDPARISSDTQEYLNTQARINYKFDPIALTDGSLFGFELSADKDLAVGVQLSNGSKSIFRYYPKMVANRNNVMMLSKLGFDDNRDFDEITSAIIFIYTHDQKDKAAVRLGNVVLFDDQSALMPYFRDRGNYMYTE